MQAKRLTEAKHWHILIVDIDNYSLKTSEDQKRSIEHLTDVVRTAPAYRTTKKRDRMALPTGDGIAVAFAGALIERPLRLAEEIHKAYGDKRYELQAGIDSGIAFETKDINKRENMAGAGINLTERILSCCSGGHVLVGQQIAERLRESSEFGPYFSRPLKFRVKHDQVVSASNFCKPPHVGNRGEPTINREFEGDYRPLARRLLDRGVRPAGALADDALRSRLAGHLLFSTIVVDGDIAGFSGIRPNELMVTMRRDYDDVVPRYIFEAKEHSPEPQPNLPKVFLLDWSAPIIDTGNVLSLTLGESDYWTTLAVEQVGERIKGELRSGALSLWSLPRRLNLVIAVVTADLKLILCKRASNVRYDPETWSLVGETIDAEQDRDRTGVVRPELTVTRALGEHDELNLPKDVAESVDIRFVAITTNSKHLISDLHAVARLPTKDSEFVKDCWSRGEGTEIDVINFTPDECISLVISGTHAPGNRRGAREPVNDFSRVGTMAALFNQFGYHVVTSMI